MSDTTNGVYGNDIITGALTDLLEQRIDGRSAASQLQKYAGGDWSASASFQDISFVDSFDWGTSSSPQTNYYFFNESDVRLSINHSLDLSNSENSGYSNLRMNAFLTAPSSERKGLLDQINITYTNNNYYEYNSYANQRNYFEKSSFSLYAKLIGATPELDAVVVFNSSNDFYDKNIYTNEAFGTNHRFMSYKNAVIDYAQTSKFTQSSNYGQLQSGMTITNYKYSDKSTGDSVSFSKLNAEGSQVPDGDDSTIWTSARLVVDNINYTTKDVSIVTRQFDAQLNQEQLDIFNAPDIDIDIFNIQDSIEGQKKALEAISLYGNNNITVKNIDGYAVDAGDGNDKVTGNLGDDTLEGGNGNDTIQGGAGDDTYVLTMGSYGADIISDSGGAYDNLTYTANYDGQSNWGNFEIYSQGTDLFVQRSNISNTSSSLMAKITNNSGNGKIEYFTYHDNQHDFTGNLIVGSVPSVGSSSVAFTTTDNFALVGTLQNDTLTAGDGNDWLFGSAGNDSLTGGAGHDHFIGGAGTDTLIGGLGNDSYNIDIKSGTQITTTATDSASIAAITTPIETIKDNAGEYNTLYINGHNQTQLLEMFRVNNKLYVVQGDPNAGVKSVTVVEEVSSIQEVGISIEDNWENSERHVSLSLATNNTAGLETDDLIVGFNTPESGSSPALQGGDGNDWIFGADGADSIYGGNGGDTLVGGAGQDTLTGGEGEDIYVLNADGTTDLIMESENAGQDVVWSNLQSTTLANNVEFLFLGAKAVTGNGNNDDNAVIGNLLSNVLDGKLGNDSMQGRSGNDTYHVDSEGDQVFENANDGVDTVNSSVNYTMADNVERLVLSNSLTGFINGSTLTVLTWTGAPITAGQVITGTGAIIGGTTITGYGTGNGGLGTYTLSSTYGTPVGSSVAPISLTSFMDTDGQGNGLNNFIKGNNGNNLLDGSWGIDTLEGGAGDDIYAVDSEKDVVVEGSGAGNDIVYSASWKWTMSMNIEKLVLIDDMGGTGIGNSAGNMIIGDDSNNTLDGKAGGDTLIGGGGNDIYFVDSSSDQVIESVDEGNDTINSSVAAATIQTLVHVENLTLLGTLASSATGNLQNNTITGNANNNAMSGLEGNDNLFGMAGKDSMDGGLGNDTLDGGMGNDTLLGGLGNDSLSGGMGVNSLTGGVGVDTFLIGESATDAINDLGVGGNDNLKVCKFGAVNATLGANWTAGSDTYNNGIANISTAGFGIDLSGIYSGSKGFNINVTGSATNQAIKGSNFNDIITGGANADNMMGFNGSDILAGGLGNDTLTGGQGSDAFVFNTVAHTSSNVDTILDFVKGEDKIQLSKIIFTGLTNFTSADFVSGNASVDTADRIIYNVSDGSLWYDADGSTTTIGAVKVAILGGSSKPTLDFSDIQIIA